MGIKIERACVYEDLNFSHKFLRRIDEVGRDSVQHFLKNFLMSNTIPDFSTIEIETINRCNNDCSFCPANRNNDTRKATIMDEGIFYTIIEQLRVMDFRGNINLFSNNEPLLDRRILKFVEYTSTKLPNAVKHFMTNGILLDKEKFLILAKNLNVFDIDNYDDNFEMIPSVKKVLDESSLPHDFKCDVHIYMRKKNQKLNTRAGTAPNRINEETKFRPQSPCNLPFTQMIIRPDGTVGKCCNDPFSKMTLGDLNNQTLREIWRGKAYQELRKEMYFNGRQNIPGCEFCDIFGLYNYLPTSAIPNEFKRLVEEFSLRKNLGIMYIFDNTVLSKNIFERFKICGVEFDGLIHETTADKNYNYVTLQQALTERAFILIPSIQYNDVLFEFFHDVGYQYEKDYLIYPPWL